MDFLNRMSAVVDHIEDHLTDEFNVNDLAQIVCCDTYQFGRIFAYVVGTTLTEYIRNRRLSLAALELKSQQSKVIDVALKYGYSSPEAFTRAFKELHGITPREAAKGGKAIKMYPKIAFQLTIKGVNDMEYRVENHDVIKGVGVTKNFGKWTSRAEGKTWQEKMGERWDFWNHFLDEGANLILRDKYQIYRKPFYQFGVTHTLENGDFIECIGAEDAGGDYPELTRFEVPAATWAIFTAKGTLDQEEHPIDQLLTKIYADWFPSSGYERAMDYTLEVYGPGNTADDDYLCEIWIPIKQKTV